MNTTATKRLKLYIFFCSNSIDVNEFTGMLQEEEGVDYRNISLPCSGKANLLYFIKAFETGADGLLLVTCGKNQCHYLEGNLRSPRRADEVNLLLNEIGMGKERIAVVTIDGDGMESVLAKVNEFRDKITSLAIRNE